MTTPVLVDREGTSTLVATLSSPHDRNALSAAMVDALLAVVDEAERTGVSVLVLRSPSGPFCSGFGLGGLADETDATLLLRFARIGILFERLAAVPCVVVAVVEGPAVGAGADLALACDHRLGTTDARFRFPGAGFGVVLGTDRLAQLLGAAQALELGAGKRWLDAQSAARRGLLGLSTHEKLEDDVTALCRGFENLDPATLAALKSAGRLRDPGHGLADLVRSIAARPGFKARLTDYVASRTRTPEPPPATAS